MMSSDPLESPPRSSRLQPWLTFFVVVGFGFVWFGGWTAYGALNYPDTAGAVILPRAIIAVCEVSLCLLIAAGLNALRSHRLLARAFAAILLSIVATLAQALLSQYVWKSLMPAQMANAVLWTSVTTDFIARLWYFVSQSSIILAMSYASDIREREQDIRALQSLAHSAQLRALRNQLNPHFLFNSLNSIAGLISAKRVGEAETMTEDLADFLRKTLALEPQQLITLDEELQLQNLYLDIEKARFPDRLRVSVDVPQELRRALVPSLVTQPLIENSIKYAVARSTRLVELAISAKRAGDMLELTVADSGGDAGEHPPKGARLGLRNVAERVHLHYGERGQFTAEPDPSGGFRNIVSVPFEVRQ
jgi:LytS/YehU family sensor histidine kinase